MSFLTPLYIAGALFVALPILFHLIRRTPRDRIPFSSLMFLRESPPRVTRRSRLENLLLLLLRATALTLFACAFARPFLREPLLAETDTGQGRVTAILLDTSASMRRDDLWQQACTRVVRALDDVRPSDHVAVFTFDRQVRTVVNFDEWLNTAPPARPALVKSALDSLQPSWYGTNLGTALAAVADSVDGYVTRVATSGSVPEQRILLVSDLQKGSDLSGLRQLDWPDQVFVELATVTARHRTNASIQLVEDRDETNDAPPADRFRVRVSNSADSEHGQFRVRWADPDSSMLDVYVAPGKSGMIQMPAAPAGDSAERLVLEGDEQDFDNTLFLVPRHRETVPVVFIGGGPAADPKNLLYYFERAFPETPWRSVRVIAHDHASSLAPADLIGARFAVLAEQATDEVVNELRDFLQAGGSVLCVLAEPDVAQSVGRLLALDDLSSDEAPLRQYAMLGDIDFQHPIFAPFSDPRYGDFTKIHFWRHRHIDLEQLADSRVLARFDDHDPALVEIPRGRGHVFLLTAGWQPIDSQLAVSSKFVPLLGGMLDYALGTSTVTLSLRVGDPAPLHDLDSGSLRVRRPNGEELELPAGTHEFRNTDQPGIYTVLGAVVPVRFAVNLDPNESDTSPMATEQLEHLGVHLVAPKNSAKVVAQAIRQRQMHAFELESRQKLWQWVIVATLAVLLVETWLAGILTLRAKASTSADRVS